MKHLFSFFLTFILGFYGLFGQTPVEKNGFIAVRGTKMYNQSGQAVQLKGIASHGMQWYDNCYTKESLKAIRDDWKADLFRITVYVNEGGYSTDTAKFLKRIDQIIGWCEELGLYYMVDWHVLSPGDPFDPTYAGAKNFFTYMAKKHGKKPNLIFELCNEPNPNVDKGGPDWSRIKSYAESMIKEIRKYTKSICVVGTPQWSQMPEDVVGNEIKEENVMYSFHFYAASHSNLRPNLTSVCNKIPMFITEWGIGSALELENVIDTVEAKTWLHYFKLNKITWSYWSFCDKGTTASLLDSGACAEKAWTKVNSTGAYMKHFMVTDAKMEQDKTFDIYKSETDKDGTMIKLVFSTKIKSISANDALKFSAKINGKPVSGIILKLTPDSTGLDIILSQKIKLGDKVEMSYNGNTIKSRDGYALIKYTNAVILNTVPPPGVFGYVEDFDDNTLSDKWINDGGKHFNLTENNKELKINASYNDQGWIPLSYQFPTISMMHTPSVTVNVKSDVAFILRIDLGDANSKSTNMNELSIKIPASETYQTYTFDFTGKFFQQYPNFDKVDVSKINTLFIYANPGKSFSGNIYFDNLIIGKKP